MSAPALTTIALERQGAVLVAWLNRPARRNALSAQMFADLAALCAWLETAGNVRCLVLRGAGGFFCSGADISEFAGQCDWPLPESGPDPIATANRAFGDVLLRLDALPQTVIAVVEGAAFGGALGLLCVADLVIAEAGARFGLSETRLGVIPAQVGPFVVRRIGVIAARRLAVTAARFDAEDALRLGLVDQLHAGKSELEAALGASIAEVLRCAPSAVAAAKRGLNATGMQISPDMLDAAANAFAAAMRGAEAREGVRAFLEKRAPCWVQDKEQLT